MLATALSLSLLACHSNGPRHGTQQGQRGDGSVRADAAPETPAHMLRRATCGRIAGTTIALGTQPRQLDLAFQSGGARTTTRVRQALGGAVCLLSYGVVETGRPDPDAGVAPSAIIGNLGTEQRRSLLPDAGVGSTGMFSVWLVDPAWAATLRQHAESLASEQGAARAEHCARIAALAPPDGAAIQPHVDERMRHFLDTGSPDPVTDAGADQSGEGGAALDTIAGLCAPVGAATPGH